jgi:hypothetical protein
MTGRAFRPGIVRYSLYNSLREIEMLARALDETRVSLIKTRRVRAPAGDVRCEPNRDWGRGLGKADMTSSPAGSNAIA